MENNFDYESVPYEYAHCFNSQCTRSQKCLHHLVAENSTSQYPTLRVINPNCIPVDTAQCPYFKSTRKLHMAWGVKRLLDNVPYKDGNALRNQLIAHLAKQTTIVFIARNVHCYPKIRHISNKCSARKALRTNPNSKDTATNITTVKSPTYLILLIVFLFLIFICHAVTQWHLSIS